jgi:hypothetical protein
MWGTIRGCTQLTTVSPREGLEAIRDSEFEQCASLHAIIIPPYHQARHGECIQRWTNAILGEGLEVIREGAFSECTSLREISIPPAVLAIHDWAFF